LTRLELAEIMLADARWNLQGARYRSAISRAYFTCYHAARACLEKRGIILTGRDPHSGTSSLFGLYLVVPGLLPRWMGRSLSDLIKQRIEADYQPTATITENMTKTTVVQAERFLQEVQDRWDRLQ